MLYFRETSMETNQKCKWFKIYVDISSESLDSTCFIALLSVCEKQTSSPLCATIINLAVTKNHMTNIEFLAEQQAVYMRQAQKQIEKCKWTNIYVDI